MSKLTHTHKYKRVFMGSKKVVRKEDGKRYLVPGDGYPVYKCVLPGCPHYVPRELAEGRTSVCWRCGGELVLTSRNLSQAKPVHFECARKASTDADNS